MRIGANLVAESSGVGQGRSGEGEDLGGKLNISILADSCERKVIE